MNVEVILFAGARELVKTPSVDVQLEEGATIADLKCMLASVYPSLSEFVNRSAFAVDQVYADDQMQIINGQEIAMIPPVSGG